MELNHLRYFYEVAKAGSFTEAARKLHISQSALSKAVSLLEQAEGVKLLERSKSGVSLTPVGSEVFQKSEGIFQAVTEIVNTCRGTKETCEGYLQFGASDHVANYLLVPRLKEMRDAHPKVIPSTFSGAPNEIVAGLLQNQLEFGLFFTPVNAPQISYEPLSMVPMSIICAPSLMGRLQREMKPVALRAAIKEVGYIGSIGADYQNHPSQTLLNLVGKDPLVSFESNSQEGQKRLCLAGGGVAYLARFMVEKEIENGSLVEISVGQPLTLQLHLARRKSRALSLNARTFLELFKRGGERPAKTKPGTAKRS